MKTSRLLMLGALLSLAACSIDRETVATPSATQTATASSTTPTVRPDLTGLSGEQLGAKALAVLRAAKSVRISQIDEDGKLTIDLSFGRTGTAAMITSDEGHRIRLVSTGKAGYLTGSDSFWRSFGGKDGKDGKALVAQLSGKWLKGELTDSNFSQFTEFLKLKAFITGPLATMWPHRPAKADVLTVNGVQCIGLTSGGITLWVDKYTARPVQLRPEERIGEQFTANFSQYDAVREPVAPAPAVVVDDTSKAV